MNGRSVKETPTEHVLRACNALEMHLAREKFKGRPALFASTVGYRALCARLGLTPSDTGLAAVKVFKRGKAAG